MKTLTPLEYAKNLLKFKNELLKLDFSEVELFMFDILVSKLLERESKQKFGTQVYYLHNIKDFTTFLKCERKTHNKTQKDFAKSLNIDCSTYSRIANGKMNISLSKFLSICDDLGYSVELYSLPF